MMKTTLISTIAVLLAYPVHCRSTECIAIISPAFANCSTPGEQGHLGVPRKECSNEEICAREFTISYVELEPYQTRYKKLFPDIFTYCCGAYTNGTKFRIKLRFPDISYLNTSSVKWSDFLFPVLGASDSVELYGHYFIPIIDVPSLVYVSAGRSRVLILKHVLRACFDLWPVLTICILMAIISGFIAWIIERWDNQEEFEPSFCKGLFDGFWWSFVTMTTIGKV